MIEELRIEDIDIIKSLEEHFEVVGNVVEDLKSNPFSHYLVYKENNEAIGFINYYLIYDRIEIANFNVLDDYQNKGIGTKLLMQLIDKYHGLVKNITLEVRIDNTKAIRIYEKMGFLRRSTREKYYDGIDGVLMEKVM